MNSKVSFEIKRFLQRALELFEQKELVCILLFGSALFEEAPRDIDIYILFTIFSTDQFDKLRTLKGEFPKMDFTFQWRDQIQSKKKYRLGNQGAYYLQILASAKLLFGENIFKMKFGEAPLSLSQKIDLLEKIDDYFLRLDQAMINPNFTQIVPFVKKYISRIALDLMFILDEIKIQDAHRINTSKRYSIIIQSLVFSHIRMSLKKIFQEDDLANYPELKNQLYKVYQRIYKLYEKDLGSLKDCSL